MTIVYEEMDIATLVPDPANPRTITDRAMQALTHSVKRFGLVQPIVVNRKTGHVVGGHQRLEALRKLGQDRAMVAIGEWTPAEERALNVTLNNAAAQGAFGDVSGYLETALRGLSAEDFRELSLDTLIPVSATQANNAADDEIPDPPKGLPVTQVGDMWQLGDHLLYCGDCRRDLSQPMAGRGINVAVTSPPYASQRKYDPASGFVPIAPDKYVDWFEAVQANVARYLAPDGSWFVNIRSHCDAGERHLYVYDLLLAHARTWHWRFVDDLVWCKGHGSPGSWPNRFKNAWEPVFHFTRKADIKFRPLQVSKPSEYAIVESNTSRVSRGGFTSAGTVTGAGHALPSNVIHTGAEHDQPHTAPYPVALPSFFVAAFSDEGDTVFDPFCGSGTTLIAAERLHRKCIAIEISPAYCDVIVERWQNVTGRMATRSSSVTAEPASGSETASPQRRRKKAAAAR